MTQLELEAKLAAMSPEELSDLDELLLSAPPIIIDPNFSFQTAFINDPARFKLLLTTRRGGKSFGIGRDLLQTGFDYPGCNLLYLALTKSSAVNIMWKDVFHKLDDDLHLNLVFKETDHSIEFPNGSQLLMGGVDSNEDERKKLYGRKYKKVAIDESGALTIDISDLVHGVIKPTLIDEEGTMMMVGMPGNVKKGLFFQATENQHPSNPGTFSYIDQKGGVEWKGYRWTGLENPYVAERFAKDVASMRLVNPDIDLMPSFRNMYLGEWATDESLLVYRYSANKNNFDGQLPPLPDKGWHHILGVDLGFKDPTAFTVLAYHRHSRVVFIRRSFKRPGWTYTQVAEETKRLHAQFRFDTFVIDGADLQGVEEMRKHQQIPWVSAKKQGKAQTIELLNAEFLAGNVLIDPVECADLVKELPDVIWTSDTKQTEHPGCENHACDSFLYAWKFSQSYTSKTPVEKPAYGTKEWQAQEQIESWQQRLKEVRSSNRISKNRGFRPARWGPSA